MLAISGLALHEGDLVAGKYRVREVLATGSMGVVITAWHEQLEQLVAIKIIREDVLWSTLAVERFVRGARATARLKSEHVAKVLDAGTLDSGAPYMVMELLEGNDLAHVSHKVGPMDVQSAVDLILQACEAVAEAHAAGIIHRDLKPENLFIANTVAGSTTLKVLDFGVSKIADRVDGGQDALRRTTSMLGSPLYMAPEQMRSSPNMDARVDVWSLGVVLFELLSHRWPFEGDTIPDLCLKVVSDAPQSLLALRPELPPGLVAVVNTCLEKEPEKRYANAGELGCALEPFASPTARAVAERARCASGGPVSSVASVRPIELASSVANAGTPFPNGAPSVPLTRPLLGSKRWFAVLAAVVPLAVAAAVGFGWGLGHEKKPSDGASPALMAAPLHAVRGVTDAEVLLGMSAAFSGPSHELGNQMKLGLDTAFSAINEAGGIAGRKLRLVALDDGYEAARAADTMKELLGSRGVFAIIGNVGTPTAQVAAPYAVADKTIFFGALTGSRLLRQVPPDRYVFNYRASYEEETSAMVRYLVDAKNVRPQEIVVFAQHDAFGDAGFDGVVKTMRKYGRSDSEILRADYERNSVDVDRAVSDIVSYNFAADRVRLTETTEVVRLRHPVRAIILVATYKPACKFIQQVRAKGLSPLFLNVSFVDSNALAEELKEVAPTIASGIIVTQVVPHPESGGTGVLGYRDALNKYHPDQQPGFVSLEGYIVASVFAEGLRRAGRELSSEKLVNALESIRDYDMGIGTIVNFGMSEHQGSHKVWGTALDAQSHFQSLDME